MVLDRIERIKKNPDHRLKGDEAVGLRGSPEWVCKVDESKGNRDVIWIANTADVDADQEVVLPGGADLDYFGRNRSVFVDHKYDVHSCIGKARTISPVEGPNGDIEAWRVRVHINKTPLGNDILTMAREMGIGCSVGLVADDFGPPDDSEGKRYKGAVSIVRKWRWLELSATAMPCNVSCQSMRESEGKTMYDLDRLVTKSMISRETARVFGLPDDRPKKRGITIFVCGNN